MQLTECRLIDLPKIDDPRGRLSVVEGGLHVPFEIKRVFYLQQVPEGATRAGHALKTCEQFIVATAGAFDAIVDDGMSRSRMRLESGNCGLYVPSMIWLELEKFLPGSVCLVLASEHYSEASYLRTYDHFRAVAA